MIRRMLIAGIGGLGGLALWYTVLSHGWLPAGLSFFMQGWIGFYSLIVFVVGCGTPVVVVFEKLRIIPTREQIDNKTKPISIFSDDRDDAA